MLFRSPPRQIDSINKIQESLQPPSGPDLAGALNASKPIEKPQTHRAGDIENHLADLNHQIAISCRRRHHASPSIIEIVSEISEFLDTLKTCVLFKIPCKQP